MSVDLYDPDVYSITVQGETRCWFCGKGEPVLEDRWCCRACRKHGREMLYHSPTPREIEEATAAIRARWTSDEEVRRSQGETVEGLAELFGWQAAAH